MYFILSLGSKLELVCHIFAKCFHNDTNQFLDLGIARVFNDELVQAKVGRVRGI